tara:strand:- start:63 stop:785 length:723 start_codon:yes stop_codon:yes gene_type:complete
MSKISLKHSGGNVVSLNSPTSAPTSADVAFKLPNQDGSANEFLKTDGSGNLSFATAGNSNPLQVLEEFFVPCDGTAVTTAQGSVSIQNVTAYQAVPSSLTTCTGSEISYQPPANTKIVVYTFAFAYSYLDADSISGFELQLDGTRVGKRPHTIRSANNNYQPAIITHPFRIESGLSADSSIGRVQSWSSAKTIRIQMRYWSSSYEGSIHRFGEAFRASDQSFENNQFHMPCVGIKAIGSV